jgi:mannan polymerase II complex MNN10 subunit
MFPHIFLTPTAQHLYFKLVVLVILFTLLVQLCLFKIPTRNQFVSPITSTLQPLRIPGFRSYGSSQCLPEIDKELVRKSISKHAVCRENSPFGPTDVRVGTVTAHFGGQHDFQRKALTTHLLHSLIHGTDVHVLCDPIIDDLWNKPAFLLNLLMREMLKPQEERLHWIMWVDRDTLILDQCRPMSSFLPPEPSPADSEAWWEDPKSSNTTHLLITNDFNGLNNGVFFVRVNRWAVEFFTAILAFRHFRPEVELKWTEQSAMEEVIKHPKFSMQVQTVPQYWFNGYAYKSAHDFKERVDENGLEEESVRRGDYLVHFAGHPTKREAINGWTNMLEDLPDVWEQKTTIRDIAGEVGEFWSHRGF